MLINWFGLRSLRNRGYTWCASVTMTMGYRLVLCPIMCDLSHNFDVTLNSDGSFVFTRPALRVEGVTLHW